MKTGLDVATTSSTLPPFRMPRSMPMRRANRRAYYRVPYPSTERPRLVIGHSICEVIDCSERGLQFTPARTTPLIPGSEVAGRLRFPRGEELPVRGIVRRMNGSRAAIELLGRGIPFSSILQEQLYLRRVLHGQRQQLPSSDSHTSG
jgi:hypothetical protein